MVRTEQKTRIGEIQNRSELSSALLRSTCLRCGGLMVNEFYMDVLDTVGELKLPAKRCVQCGEVVDFVILINRQQEQQPMTIQLAAEMSSHSRMTKGQ